MKVPGVDVLREALAALSLDSRGHRQQLKKRLRTAQKREEERQRRLATHDSGIDVQEPKRPAAQDFDSYLVLDVEATCQKYRAEYGNFFSYPNEIIEFPVLLLQWRQRPSPGPAQRSRSSSVSSDEASPGSSDVSLLIEENDSESSDGSDSTVGPHWDLVVVDQFRSFVRPTWRPKLTKFCKELTGITQAEVDAAPTFPEVLELFKTDFMRKHDLFTKYTKTTWVTDGPWDLRDFVGKQCYISGIGRPSWLAGTYIDLRTSSTLYFSRDPATVQDEPPSIVPPPIQELGQPNIVNVLAHLKLEPFIGREHSGIDDCRNLARILQELVRPERAWSVKANAELSRENRWSWMKRGEVAWYHPFYVNE